MTKPKITAGKAGGKANAGGLKGAPLKTTGAQARTTPKTAKGATPATASRASTRAPAKLGSGAARTGKSSKQQSRRATAAR